ncbi:MAG: hypothetical protein VB108_05810 [Anaerolineaceae bacterium]|nr:hypothetical protein [Anaerolineaceae bacterium]
MINIIPVDSKARQKKMVEFQFELYKDCPQWVPPFKQDIYMMMNKKKHPFYDHSISDQFLAEKDGKIVGRIAALLNRPFNAYHHTNDAEFYLFDCINDQEVANALFDKVAEWAKEHGMNRLVGPKGYGPLDGYGIQIMGQEHRAMMNMLNYNYIYYKDLVESYGFEKEVDFVSSYLKPEQFVLPEKVNRAAELALKRGRFEVKSFKTKKEMREWVSKIAEAYNSAFVNNWEYYPLSEKEIKMVIDNVIAIVQPETLFVLLKEGKVVGFELPFPDISAAMQKNKGKLGPIEIIRLMREIKKTDWFDFNGIGFLPEAKGFGGNAIFYKLVSNIVLENPQYKHIELSQVAETAKEMRQDLANLGVQFYKNHRVYKKNL